jgi:hypothetical protein
MEGDRQTIPAYNSLKLADPLEERIKVSQSQNILSGKGTK